jgi:hypothetical protein
MELYRTTERRPEEFLHPGNTPEIGEGPSKYELLGPSVTGSR